MQKNGMNGLSAMTARCRGNNGAAGGAVAAVMRVVWMDRGRRCGGRALLMVKGAALDVNASGGAKIKEPCMSMKKVTRA